MRAWTEADSSIYREIADIAVPRREEMTRAMLAAVPFAPDDSFRIIELGSGEGGLAYRLLEAFPQATITALDGSESMRQQSEARLARFGDRARVRRSPPWLPPSRLAGARRFQC